MASLWFGVVIVALIAIAIPVLMAWFFWSIFRKDLNIFPALIFTLAGTISLSIYGYGLTSDCYYSYRLGQYIKTSLSQEEIAALKADELICPISYKFVRSGKKSCVMSLGGEVGAGKCP